MSLRSAETDGRADLGFEPNEGVMVYYETVEYERFVSSRFGVNGVEKSTTRTVIPEVGVVVSTSGQVSKMADVE